MYILLSLLLLSYVAAQICLDPISEFYCQAATQEECCGGTCETGFWGAMPASPGNCDLGCCYAQGGQFQVCVEQATFRGECNDLGGGTFATDCDGIDECKQGCCCYLENTKQSDVMLKGDCTLISGSQFQLGTTDTNACSSWCDTVNIQPPGGTVTQCNDSINNDPGEDALVDCADSGCWDELGNCNEKDNSESLNAPECTDLWDNDGDGKTDMLDACCQQFPTREEDFCQLPACNLEQKVPTQIAECRCQDTYRCTSGKYCCVDGCKDNGCTIQQCVSGSRAPCGTTDANGCPLFKYCIDGAWDENCAADPSCGIGFEICDNGIDDDSDGQVDCYDASCQGAQCDTGYEPCQTKGYVHPVSGLTVCCPGTVNDCDNDGTKETCGQCNCNESLLPISPVITDVATSFGSRDILVDWDLNCDVPNYLYRCIGTDCSSRDQFEKLSDELSVRQFTDVIAEDAEPGIQYCYYIEAQFVHAETQSDIECVSAGDQACYDQVTESFCLDRVTQARCTEDNLLQPGDNCEDKHGLGFVCNGPYPDGETRCIYQSPCDECGEPLSMFANPVTSRTTYYEAGWPGAYDRLCSEVPTCYYDYSETSVDEFQPCTGVYSCYDYRSQSACSGQPSAVSNNKCIPRNCEWQPMPTVSDIDTGVCTETEPAYQTCGACNDAQNNNIFDACTLRRCQAFGDCYLRHVDDKCVDASNIICYDYRTEEECTGGHPVSVDAKYDSTYYYRVDESGVNHDNSVDPSYDVLGIGLCRWDGTYCIKDADGNNRPDGTIQIAYDMTPPDTRLASPTKVLSLNLTFEASDFDDSGKGSGVWKVYVCESNGAYCYPTQAYLPEDNRVELEFGAYPGQHDYYFYSEDYANNLEVVKKVTIEVDRQPPVISLQYNIVPDMETFKDSKAMFSVTLDEGSYCRDFLDGAAGQIKNEYGTNWVKTYGGLSDGTYTYTVNCTDALGNTASASVDVSIDADKAAFEPTPSGKLDYSPIELTIKTDSPATCRWDTFEGFYGDLRNQFTSSDQDGYYLHTASFSPSVSDSYSIDVKCDLGGRVSDDEIQFVFDATPPMTQVLDDQLNPFDFQKLYSGVIDKVFLKCIDLPLNGFGCKETMYCVSDSNCQPDTLSDPQIPIDFGELGDSTVLCYYSVENEINSMGGLFEQVKCNEVSVDHYPPQLRILDIGQNNRSTDPYVTLEDTYNLRGTITDPDALTGGSNHVRILVQSATNAADKTEYELDAQGTFAQRIYLWPGINVVTVIATDRSGATDTKTVYINKAEYTGERIFLISPPFGVSETQVFDFVVMTYMEADCRWSLNNVEWYRSVPMQDTREPKGEDYDYFHTYENMDAGPVSEVEQTVYVKCRDIQEIIYQKAFNLSWDDTPPEIKKITLSNSDGKEPPSVVDWPLETALIVQTDDDTRCRYSTTNENFAGMDKFDNYDTQQLMTVNRQNLTDLVDKTQYTFYVRCENGAGLVSESKAISFAVDTSKATGFTWLSPEKATTETSLVLSFRTDRETSDCRYGADLPTNPMTDIDSKTHEAPIVVSEGKQKYYVDCLTTTGRISDSYSFVVDTSPPSVPEVTAGEYTNSIYELRAKWESEDSLSDVVYYNFSIGTVAGNADTFPWTGTDRTKKTVGKLNLTRGETYYWSVRAQNEVGLWSLAGHSLGTYVNETDGDVYIPEGSCANGILDFNETGVDCGGVCPNDCPAVPDTCTNGIMDGDETDLDCGGSCLPCGVGGCEKDADCQSGSCIEGECVLPTCDDGLWSPFLGETDKDCGGAECPQCTDGMKCQADSDCISWYCSKLRGVCAVPSCTDGEQNGDENGTDCGGSCEPCGGEDLYTCNNGRQDGDETGVDCGGSCDAACEPGAECVVNEDCDSDICVDGVCQAQSCTDGIFSPAYETDLDCGNYCDCCDDGRKCRLDSDCCGDYCSPGKKICTSTSCDDAIQNGDEEGIDCGGSCPESCPAEVTPLPYQGDGGDDDEPTRWWVWIILVIAILTILGGGGYLGYTEYQKRHAPPPSQKIAYGPIKAGGHGGPPPKREKTPQEKYIDSLASMIRKKRGAMKKKDRSKLLSAFDEKPEKLQPVPVKTDGKAGKPAPSKPGQDGKEPPSGKPKPPAGKADIQPPKQPGTPPKTPSKKPAGKPPQHKALEELSTIGKKNAGDALDDLYKVAKKKKKGQVTSQMFIYITAIILIGLLLLFGISWIGKLTGDWEKIRRAEFAKDLTSEFDNIRNDYGDKRTITFDIPSSIDMVCFVDIVAIRNPSQPPDFCTDTSDIYDPLICNAYEDNTSAVLFSPPFDLTVDLGPVMMTGDKYKCYDLDKTHSIDVVLRGLGNKVQVE